MSVRGINGPTLLENDKKVVPGKKEQIFSKTVSVAASSRLYLYLRFLYSYSRIYIHVQEYQDY